MTHADHKHSEELLVLHRNLLTIVCFSNHNHEWPKCYRMLQFTFVLYLYLMVKVCRQLMTYDLHIQVGKSIGNIWTIALIYTWPKRTIVEVVAVRIIFIFYVNRGTLMFDARVVYIQNSANNIEIIWRLCIHTSEHLFRTDKSIFPNSFTSLTFVSLCCFCVRVFWFVCVVGKTCLISWPMKYLNMI